jgi:hypothetical protein
MASGTSASSPLVDALAETELKGRFATAADVGAITDLINAAYECERYTVMYVYQK